MSDLIGRQVEIGIATEATKGTAESTVDRWNKKVTATIVEKAEKVEDDTTQGRLEDMEQSRVVSKWVEGELSGIAHVDAIGYLFASLYGVVNTSTVSGSVKDHVFTLKQGILHQSLTLFGIDGDAQSVKYAGCMVNTLELNATVGDYVRFSANIVGESASDHSEVSSYNTEYNFIGRDITVKLADTEAGLSGATAIPLKELSVKWDQGLIRDHTFGSYNPSGVYNSKMAIDGSFTLNFTDETYKDLYLSDTAKYMQIVIQGTEDLGSGNYPTITTVFNKVQIKDWNRDGGADELTTQPISFKAYLNETDGEQSTTTLRNLTSAYANVPSA